MKNSNNSIKLLSESVVFYSTFYSTPDSKVHGTNMGRIWGRQESGWLHELCYLGHLVIIKIWLKSYNNNEIYRYSFHLLLRKGVSF